MAHMLNFFISSNSMFQLVFQNNDGINCESDDLDVPNQDFCSSRSVDGYLRVYSIIVGDFELADYRQESSVTFLWYCVTLFGAVVLLNVLIAGKTLPMFWSLFIFLLLKSATYCFIEYSRHVVVFKLARIKCHTLSKVRCS
jgi:hypothetical protein